MSERPEERIIGPFGPDHPKYNMPDEFIAARQVAEVKKRQEVDWEAAFPLPNREVADKYWYTWDAEQTHTRVAQMWDWSNVLPFPKWDAKCPVCRSGEVLVKRWSYVANSQRTVAFHCDVYLGCMTCSHHWVHGVPVPPDVEIPPVRFLGSRLIYHREIRGGSRTLADDN